MDETNTATARCRLCLQSLTDGNFAVLGDFEKNMLETLAPLINLNSALEQKLCEKCATSLQVSYDLKALWLQNNESVKKLLILRELCPLLSLASCGICGQMICDAPVDGDETNWKEMVETCVPELDVCFGDKISACRGCVEELRSVYTFINDITDVEKKIEDYCLSNDKLDVDLEDVSRFFSVPISEGESEASREFNGIKEEDMTRSNENCTENVTQEGHLESHITLNQTTDAPVTISSSVSEESASLDPFSITAIQDTIENSNEAPTSTETKRKRGTDTPPNQYQCDQCSYSAKHKSALKSHLMRHKDPSETTMFKCPECDHETKRKADLQTHMKVHKDYHEVKTFKCDQCPYQSVRKCDLKSHLFSHQPKNLKCPYCPYVTNNPIYLEKFHALVHKDKLERPMYKCAECSYETYYKSSLKTHAVVHKSSTETPRYKCNWCEYETHSKANLRFHMNVHKCSSEVPMYECYYCGHKTRRKHHLKEHIQIHTNFAGGETYYCTECPFETKRKNSLNSHRKSHSVKANSNWYKCEFCKYKTIREDYFMAHISAHEKEAEYPCYIATFGSLLGVIQAGGGMQ